MSDTPLAPDPPSHGSSTPGSAPLAPEAAEDLEGGATGPSATPAESVDAFEAEEISASLESTRLPSPEADGAAADSPEAEDLSETPEAAERAAARPVNPESPERKALEAAPSSRCLNCQAELPGEYCPACGQKEQALRQPVHKYLVEALSEYLGLDGRVWPSLGALLFRPGRLTKAYVVGRRQQYVRPLRIYITSSLLFFFLLALIDPVGKLRSNVDSPIAADSTLSAAAYLTSLDQAIAEQRESDAEQRALVDSLRGLASQGEGRDSVMINDSVSVSLDSVLDDLETEEETLAEDSSSTYDRRLAMQRSWVVAADPDSMVRPADLQQAAEIIIPREQNFNLGPEWMLGSESLRRLKGARTSQERTDAAWAFGREAIRRIPTVVFLLLPVFALFMKLLYVRRGWYYAEHLVFALHVHAFAFAIFSVYAVLIWASGGGAALSLIGSILLLAIPVYFIVAQKRVYAQGWGKTLVKAYLLSWLYAFALFGGAILAVVLAAAMG